MKLPFVQKTITNYNFLATFLLLSKRTTKLKINQPQCNSSYQNITSQYFELIIVRYSLFYLALKRKLHVFEPSKTLSSKTNKSIDFLNGITIFLRLPFIYVAYGIDFSLIYKFCIFSVSKLNFAIYMTLPCNR